MCITGFEIIYIQVAYLTAPVARSHSTPPLFKYNHTQIWHAHTWSLFCICWLLPKSCFQQLYFPHSHRPCSFFSFDISHPYRVCVLSLSVSLSHIFSECSFYLTFYLSVNITSQLLVKPWSVFTVCGLVIPM